MSENYDIIKIIEMPKNVSNVIPVEIQKYGRDLNVEQLIVPQTVSVFPDTRYTGHVIDHSAIQLTYSRLT